MSAVVPIEMNPFEQIGPLTMVSWNGNRGGRIAAFDLDYTLIRPKGRNKFPRDATDWKWT